MTPKAQGKHQSSKDLRQRLQDAINRLFDAITKLVEWTILPLWTWLGVRWDRLSLNGQKAVYICLWLAGAAFGIYSAWFARLHNMTAPVVRWGWLRVEARYGVWLLTSLLLIPGGMLIDRLTTWSDKTAIFHLPASGLLRRWQGRILPPLMLARWLYLRHQDALALERTQALLARDPNNAAARELLALIEKRIAEHPADAPDTPQTPPRAAFSDRLADSKFPSIASLAVVVLMFCLTGSASLYYARTGLMRGWDTTVWVGVSRYGSVSRTSAIEASLACFVMAALCALYLTYAEDGFANTTAWKKYKAKRAAKRDRRTPSPLESET